MNKSIAALAMLLCTFATPASAASEPDELLPGNVAVVKPGSLAKFVSKAATVFDLPDPLNDPVTQGGTLHLFDTVARPGGDVTFTLTAGATKWKALGSPPGSKGYKYKGAGTPGDPCRVVLIKSKVVKAVCKGPDVALTLPFQGDLAVVLTVGADAKRYCAEFGGTPKGNPATIFKRKGAPLPGLCPNNVVPIDTPTPTVPPPATATATDTATTTNTPTNTPLISCEDTAFPTCGGFCPGTLQCLPTGPGNTCNCDTPASTSTPTVTATPTQVACGAANAPACDGQCSVGLTCQDVGGFCSCQMPVLCGQSFPACNGSCPAGETCLTTDEFCGCAQLLPCGADGQPCCGAQHGGTCDPGLACATDILFDSCH